MKRRGIALALAVLLCAMSILSCALPALHANHACEHTVCAVCTILTQIKTAALGLAIVFVGMGFLFEAKPRLLYAAQTSCLSWNETPVRRKVKLLD